MKKWKKANLCRRSRLEEKTGKKHAACGKTDLQKQEEILHRMERIYRSLHLSENEKQKE